MDKLISRWARFILIFFVAVGGFLRIWHIDSLPPSLTWDEVSIGYNAYSILQTGKDEHQKVLPLDAFAAYGDYKPPFSIYLTVPFVAIFGLNETAVRLPSAIVGTLSILVLYACGIQLLRPSAFAQRVSLFSAGVMALSPWHIQLSRAGYEANIAVGLVLLGIWLVASIHQHPKLLFVCWIPFVLSMYTFNSARYFVLFFTPALFLYFQKSFVSHWKRTVVGIGIAGIVLSPLVPFMLSPLSRLRFAEVNIFTDPTVVTTANMRQEADASSFLSKILHNRRVGFAREYIINILDHFEPWFLYIQGDGNPKFSTQQVGQLYLLDSLFFIIGILYLFRYQKALAVLLAYWIFVSLVPAAAARETPHALRIENSMPAFLLFVSVGAYVCISFFTKRWVWARGIILAAYCIQCVYFWHGYVVHYAREYSTEWQYGYREAIAYAESVQGAYQKIVLSEHIGRAYMYVLFYTVLDPNIAWKTIDGSFDASGLYNVYSLGKYEFARAGAGEVQDHTLYILHPSDVPQGVYVHETVKNKSGDPALVIFSKS